MVRIMNDILLYVYVHTTQRTSQDSTPTKINSQLSPREPRQDKLEQDTQLSIIKG
jgi:hypothetical protein